MVAELQDMVGTGALKIATDLIISSADNRGFGGSEAGQRSGQIKYKGVTHSRE